MPHVNMLESPLAALVVVDMQAKFLDAITSDPPTDTIDRIGRLVAAARIFELPVFVTEQYPKGLGSTDKRVVKSLGEAAQRFEKTTMSCWRDGPFRAALKATGREQIILCGIEAHVCIQQTALDLIRMDYQVFVPVDSIASRFGRDKTAAVDRMRAAGAEIVSAEAVIFELVERCDHPRFKDVLKIVK